MRGNARLTAVVCYSNFEATLIVHAMWPYGVSIPGDLSIVGFNDLFATRYMTPPLTAVGYNAAKVGELGAELVLKSIKSREAKRPVVRTLKPKLIVRGSTGPPPTHKASARTAKGAPHRASDGYNEGKNGRVSMHRATSQ